MRVQEWDWGKKEIQGRCQEVLFHKMDHKYLGNKSKWKNKGIVKSLPVGVEETLIHILNVEYKIREYVIIFIV